MTIPTEEILPKSRVVVDGDVSAEKLLRLIRLGIEEERLEYKNEYNLSGSGGTKDKVEFVRDVIGMANTYGGYIVLGVHEITDSTGKHFSPEGITPEAGASLDVSMLRQQVEAHVSERVEIQFKLHQMSKLGNNSFGIIFVPQSSHSPIIFSKDGQYKDKGDERGRSICLFRAGDIVVRKGASTARADQSDMRRLVSDVRRREKSTWTEEILGIRGLVQKLDQLIGVLSNTNTIVQQESSDGVASHSTGFDETLLYLSPSFIYEKMIDLLDIQREVSVRRYIQRAGVVFFEHLEEPKSGDANQVLEIRDNKLIPLLDCLLVIGVGCIEYKNWELFKDVQAAFYRIFHRANRCSFPKLKQDKFLFDKIWVWQEVIVRVYSLGAVLVHRRHWAQAKRLVQQEIEWDEYWRTRYWSRYILTMAARANQLEKKGWVPPVVDNIESHKWLSDLFMADNDVILNAVCQFDFLQCVYTDSREAHKLDVAIAYPSFGLYHKSRTEPVIARLVVPGELRNSISEVNDEDLAIFIRALDKFTDSEFFAYDGWVQGGWSDKRIVQFLNKHITAAQ